MAEHRVQLGDQFRMTAHASVITTMRARVLVEFDSGKLRSFNLLLVSTADSLATQKSFGNLEGDGHVVRAVVARITPVGLERGRCFVNLGVIDRNGAQVDQLAQDYLYDTNNLSLGRYGASGPGGGNGFKQNRVIADDIAPVDVTHAFGIANTRRRIDGFIWYYHASADVANRTLRVSARSFGDGLPTGMTTGGNTLIGLYPSAGAITLTGDQEGTIYVNAGTGKSFAISIDNGIRTIENITTEPDPFPYWAGESDVGEFFFDVVDAEAADRHSISIIEETWIEA